MQRHFASIFELQCRNFNSHNKQHLVFDVRIYQRYGISQGKRSVLVNLLILITIFGEMDVHHLLIGWRGRMDGRSCLGKNYQYSFAENTGDAGQSKRPLRALVFSSMVLAALSWSSLSLCSSSAILSDARMDAFRGVIFGLPAWISCSFSSTYAARCLMYSSWASPLMVYLWRGC